MRLPALVLLMVALASSAPTPSVAARQAATDEEAAATAAVELSRLEAGGQYDALYDRMHPDARAVVPREAVVGWYQEWTALNPPPVIATVTGVRFVSWTWEISGVTYGDAAEVSYAPPYYGRGGEIRVPQDRPNTVRLVKHAGGWGWFFGRDRAWVEEQIFIYAPAAVAPTPTPASAPLDAATLAAATDGACEATARYWEGEGSAVGLDAEGVEVFSGCRRDASGGWFFPTGPDDTRLVDGSPLSGDEEARVAPLRREIEAQLAALDRELDANPSPYRRMGDPEGETMLEAVDRLGAALHPPGRPEAENVGPQGATVLEWYEPVLLAHLSNPDNLDLGLYAGWWFGRRQAAFPTDYCQSGHPMMCGSARLALGVDRGPWPWELAAPLTMDEYLDWALANGRIASATTPPTAGEAASGTTYTSPQFGFRVTWGASWAPESATTEFGSHDHLRLTAPTEGFILEFRGVFTDDEDAALRAYAEERRLRHPGATTEFGPVSAGGGSAASVPSAFLAYTDGGVEMIEAITVYPIVKGESALLRALTRPADADFEVLRRVVDFGVELDITPG